MKNLECLNDLAVTELTQDQLLAIEGGWWGGALYRWCLQNEFVIAPDSGWLNGSMMA